MIPALLRLLLYGAEWGGLYLAWRCFNRQRPDRPLPQSYLLVVGILAVLQLYGEAWHR